MTSTDIIPPPRWRDRLRLSWGLFRAAVFFAVRRKAPLPGIDGQVHLCVRVPQSARGTRLEALAEIADKMGTEETLTPLDVMNAERRFGPVRVVASVQGPEYTAHLARLSAPATLGSAA